MMTRTMHNWIVVLVCLAHLLEASRIRRQAVPNVEITTAPVQGQPNQPASSPLTETELNKVCGVSKISSTQVEQGRPAELGQFPWMAAIFFNNENNYVTCGGALISEQYVLTAAHCAVNLATGQKRNASDITVRLGDLDIATDTDKATPVELKVVEVIPYEKYNRTASEGDVALLKLEKAAQFSDLITPICLPTPAQMVSDKFEGRKPTVAGWGTVGFGGESSQILQFVVIDVIPNSECQTTLNQIIKFNVSQSQLCAVQKVAGKAACQGDGGGPLMLQNPDSARWYSIGIVSGGVGCGKYPDLYTRTTSYLDWIKKNAKIN